MPLACINVEMTTEPPSVYLKALVDDGLLREVKAGRENLYINPALIELLTADRRQ
ncbi:hypothetical protein [Agrobacterium pusense]|uniref:hypothetical protein n=1 Tax=Agrobacterium pusense TaxID=648995 RepID=UPI0032D9FB2F